MKKRKKWQPAGIIWTNTDGDKMLDGPEVRGPKGRIRRGAYWLNPDGTPAEHKNMSTEGLKRRGFRPESE